MTDCISSLYWCLIEFIDWRYSQSCWYFRPSFVNYCPSNLLSGSPPHPSPPSQSQSTEHTESVWLKGGREGGVELCRRPYSAGAHSLLTRFRTYKLLYHPEQKPRREWGFRQINTCRKVLYRSISLDNDIGIAFYQSNLSTDSCVKDPIRVSFNCLEPCSREGGITRTAHFLASPEIKQIFRIGWNYSDMLAVLFIYWENYKVWLYV